MRRERVGVAIALGTIVSVGGALWANRPFQAELGSYCTSLADRSEAQRHNIGQAVRALDGVVVEPGETWSFNRAVGPRTPERGYREAPAFMERDLVTSLGGGICQVSSTVYNAAAQAGMTIVERHPHFRRVASVPAGRDATVWYGMADLRFKNPFTHPVTLRVTSPGESLAVTMLGHRADAREVRLVTRPIPSARYGHETFRTTREVRRADGAIRQEPLSLDVYRSGS